MYTLYYLPGSCSLAVHVALIEVGAQFTIENVSVPAGQSRSSDFLKINPRGNVPVLKKGNFILREGAAILTTLLDDHKSPLLPQTGEARAQALEWLSFANASLHPAYGRIFFFHKQLGETASLNPLYDPAVVTIQKYWDEIEERLTTQDYVCGGECTIADILITVIANWTPNIKKQMILGSKTRALFKRVTARPAFQKAIAAEKVTYKMAA